MKKIILYFNPSAKKIFVEKADESGKKKVVLSSHHNFVYTAEIVARVIDIDSDEQIPTRVDPNYKYYNVVNYIPIKAGSGVYFDETTGSFKASGYGFITVHDNTLRLVPVIAVTRDKVSAYISVFPTKFKELPSVNDIQEGLQELGIVSGLGESKIKEAMGNVDPNVKKLTRVLVASGKASVEGVNEYYTALIDFHKKAGELLEDGSMNFKEVGSIVQIKKGDKILQRVPEVLASDGYDVYGNKISATKKVISGYKVKQGLVNSPEDENILVANLDGCVEVLQKVVSVSAVVIIKGDVDYDSGNIDFNGSVVIQGSVLPGFSVKATGDVTIEQSVEDSLIEAGGDVIIQMGAVGKNGVKILAGGNVTAKYLLNAEVEAAGDITVEDSIINCNVFSNNIITVVAQSGKIIGGTLTAFYGIEAKVAGAINETVTKLYVGRNLFIERELEVVQEKIDKVRETVNDVISDLRMNYGDAVFENPMEYIKVLPGVKKKKCLISLKELSEGNGTLKAYIAEKDEIEDRLELLKEPTIKILETIYPGTTINLKKMVRKISEVMENVKFYEYKEQKLIRFKVAS